jgi:hypothetical protein
LRGQLTRREQVDVAELVGAAVKLAGERQNQCAAGSKRAEQGVEHGLAAVGRNMFEHFGTNRQVMLAKLERQRRVLEMGGHGVEAGDIGEEGRVDVDRADPAPGGGERFGEHAAADADLEHPVAGRGGRHGFAKHPVAPRAVEAAAGRVGVAVEPPLELDIALAGHRGLGHGLPSSPMVSRMT